MQTLISPCDGVVFVTPEYNGGLSSVIKLITESLGYPSILADKPSCLVGIAAGGTGAFKSIEQLRSICATLETWVEPQSLSIAGVQNVYVEGM